MMLSDLPPVGGRVSWGKSDSPLWFSGYEAVYVDSGTSALALALITARHLGGVKHPEVILPAYGCPDLVAATIYAGCNPVLVDLSAEKDPCFDLVALKSACNKNTVAVVAVNFLGVREKLQQIREVIPDHTLLIEDNAQWFPELKTNKLLVADFSISSFGRGKPASVLGGGLLLVRNSIYASSAELIQSQIAPSQPISPLKKRVIVALYNVLLNPFLYVWLNRNPFLSLGETHYDRLEQIHSLDPIVRQQIPANVSRYTSRSRSLEKQLDEFVMRTKGVSSPGLVSLQADLSPVLEKRRGRLLRYPVVFDNIERAERVFQALDKKGLGVSRMYKVPLINIPGVSQDVVLAGTDSNAQAFAQRLLTLPVHEGVSDKHVELICKVLAET